MVCYLMTSGKVRIIRVMTGYTFATVAAVYRFVIHQVVQDTATAASIYKSSAADSVGMTRAAATMDTNYKVRIRGRLTLVMTRRTFRRISHYARTSSTIIGQVIHMDRRLAHMTVETGYSRAVRDYIRYTTRVSRIHIRSTGFVMTHAAAAAVKRGDIITACAIPVIRKQRTVYNVTHVTGLRARCISAHRYVMLGGTTILGIIDRMVVTVKVTRMTRRTFATIGYCAALQAAIGGMTLLTGSTAACGGTVMDCRYDITCMTTNTVNSRAARISVHKHITEACRRMIQLMEVPV